MDTQQTCTTKLVRAGAGAAPADPTQWTQIGNGPTRDRAANVDGALDEADVVAAPGLQERDNETEDATEARARTATQAKNLSSTDQDKAEMAPTQAKSYSANAARRPPTLVPQAAVFYGRAMSAPHLLN